MKRVSQFVLPGDLDIDILCEKGKIAYTFLYKGESYGNAVTLPSRKLEDIVAACLVLFTNAIETKKELDKI
jgi:hypothetical protein